MIDIEKLAQDMSGTVLVNGKEYYEIDSKEWTNLAEAYAAKVLEDKEREIAELKQERNDLNYLAMERLHKIEELQAHINDLREALEEITNTDPDEGTQWFHSKAEQALAITPAQSLQEFENEVIERCAKVCDDSWDGAEIKIEILKLKGKQNGT